MQSQELSIVLKCDHNYLRLAAKEEVRQSHAQEPSKIMPDQSAQNLADKRAVEEAEAAAKLMDKTETEMNTKVSGLFLILFIYYGYLFRLFFVMHW